MVLVWSWFGFGVAIASSLGVRDWLFLGWLFWGWLWFGVLVLVLVWA